MSRSSNFFNAEIFQTYAEPIAQLQESIPALFHFCPQPFPPLLLGNRFHLISDYFRMYL